MNLLGITTDLLTLQTLWNMMQGIPNAHTQFVF
jgi:hypothetical protein